jgi:MFS transporter, DHA1 family, multidrug resistance protein
MPADTRLPKATPEPTLQRFTLQAFSWPNFSGRGLGMRFALRTGLVQDVVMEKSWKRQMGLVWATQFLSIMGFAFALPFAAFFLQKDLGVVRRGELQLWVALFSASAALAMAATAPIWGALADRYGKRIMLIRANLAGALAMSLMGAAQTPEGLIGLRLLQGAFTGTMTAAQAFLAGEVPTERRGLALGGLSAAVFSGSMAGAFLGGLAADALGYRAAFYVSGGLLLLAGVLAMLCKKENPSQRTATGAEGPQRRGFAGYWRAMPTALAGVLGMIGAIAFVRQFDMSFLPLLVQDVHGSLHRVSSWSGGLFAVGSVAGLMAGLSTGWLSDRINPLRMVVAAALLASVFSWMQASAYSFEALFPIRFLVVFFAGSMEPALNSWLAKRVPEARHGIAFGLASTTRSLGWTLGPLLAGAVAAVNLRLVFRVAAAGYVGLAVLFAFALHRQAIRRTRGA